MKKNEIIKGILADDFCGNKGVIKSGLFETCFEFVERFFGEYNINGGFKNNTEYLYCYGEPLSGVPDMVLNDEQGERIYLYEIE